MILLQPAEYKLAVAGLEHVSITNLFARSVVEQHVDGKVYVDEITNPGAFYVVHPYGMSLLYGDISDHFLQSHLKDYILGHNGLRKAVEFLQVFPAELESRIDRVLGKNLCVYGNDKDGDNSKYTVIKHKRVNFKFNHKKYKQFLSTIDLTKYNFREVDEPLYNETKGSVVPNKFWNNASEFAMSGVGFSLMCDNEAVAVAFSSFVHDGMFEMGMETMEKYRQKGFASIICAKFVEYCLERSLEPVWACKLGNEASYNLAIKLGFEPIAFLPYYELVA